MIDAHTTTNGRERQKSRTGGSVKFGQFTLEELGNWRRTVVDQLRRVGDRIARTQHDLESYLRIGRDMEKWANTATELAGDDASRGKAEDAADERETADDLILLAREHFAQADARKRCLISYEQQRTRLRRLFHQLNDEMASRGVNIEPLPTPRREAEMHSAAHDCCSKPS